MDKVRHPLGQFLRRCANDANPIGGPHPVNIIQGRIGQAEGKHPIPHDRCSALITDHHHRKSLNLD